ncbi:MULTISPECIES: DUF3037 domain-containing protein [Frankia]|uniref:DUF3037 domain-containing protein n=1 Tax=Frankia alni (strain DSM 45986 / CECT 9034 / ACN14a) TaxID=326424 RepID=Q0RPV6_FRAAA|nr:MULTISPECIES: DUF3037 domain-containing protein [Frankia]CAJ60423.1 conserved hypothetical protein [Frankia alni ACN14a]
MRELFEYAVIRIVPRVERGEFVNVGVMLYCQRSRYLDLRCRLDEGRLGVLDPYLDPAVVVAHLAAFHAVCCGGEQAGPAGRLTAGERFRWLTAPRSTVVQTSPVHTGLTADPAAELDRLASLLVDPPGPPSAPDTTTPDRPRPSTGRAP